MMYHGWLKNLLNIPDKMPRHNRIQQAGIWRDLNLYAIFW